MLVNRSDYDDVPYRVLIVDDDAQQRSLQKEILSGSQYCIYEASNGLEAISLLKKYEIDVVLLDKNMPGLNGDEVSRYIRVNLKKSFLPIIIVTGNHQHDELVASLNAGATDFISKPYNTKELLARLSSAANNKRLTDQLDSAESVLFALARMVEAKDGNTGEHCNRLEHSAAVFGESLGLDCKQVQALRRGGVLHDIGKLAIPDRILLKEGPLNEEEWGVMRKHTEIGAMLCSSLKSMEMTVPIIRYHHERWNGSGYPDGLIGEEIPFLARVFQIVDIFDAMTNERPYKNSYPIPKAIELFEKEVEKGLLDPYLVDKFIGILNTRPDDLLLPAGQNTDLGGDIFGNIVQAFRTNAVSL